MHVGKMIKAVFDHDFFHDLSEALKAYRDRPNPETTGVMG